MNAAALTISTPQWVIRTHQNHVGRQRISLIAGLEATRPYGRDDGLVEIDASIAPLIVALNAAGYITAFCCSNLPEDHEGDKLLSSIAGYILFAEGCTPPADMAPAGVTISWNGDHWRLDEDREACRRQWLELARKLGVDLIP